MPGLAADELADPSVGCGQVAAEATDAADGVFAVGRRIVSEAAVAAVTAVVAVVVGGVA